jgi:hypothetical protein
MPVYTYLAQDTLTQEILGELPLHGVTFDRQLNKAGNFQGSANWDNELIANEDLFAYTEPGRTNVYAYRDDQIVWGGIIWTRTEQSQGKSIQLTAQTFESYPYRRIHRPVKTKKYIGNQCKIIRDLWAGLQVWVSNSNIGVATPSDTELPSIDVTRTITVNPWDLRSYGDIIDEITKFDDGCDYFIDVFESSGIPYKRLVLDYPTVGARQGASNLFCDYPGNILNYFRTDNASEGNTKWFASGDGDEAAKIIGSATDNGRLASGYLRLEAAVSYSGVTKQATIDAHAAADLRAAPVPRVKWQFEIKADEEPHLGSFGLGDDTIVTLEGPRYPEGGSEFVFRCVGWGVTPSSSESTEEMTLLLEGQDDDTSDTGGG